jgi:hypothetical protein
MADLRDRLERESARVDLAPDLLDRVFEGRRRREMRRRVAAGVTAGALSLAVFVWLAVGLTGNAPERPAARPTPLPVAGTYRTTLDASDPVVADLDLAGTYALTLRPNGVIRLETPPGFEETYESASGDAYRVAGNVVTIGSFTSFSCPGTVGTYRAELTATELRLTPIDEPCAFRAAIFGSRPWTMD